MQYRASAVLHPLQFTVSHALGFSVFTSRILATDLQQSHCNFKSHVKFSCHYSAAANSIQFLCSHAHILAGWRLETRLFTSLNGLSRSFLYNYFAWTTWKTQPLYC
jgi:hypothetical protein